MGFYEPFIVGIIGWNLNLKCEFQYFQAHEFNIKINRGIEHTQYTCFPIEVEMLSRVVIRNKYSRKYYISKVKDSDHFSLNK